MFAKLKKGRSQAKAAPVNLPKNLTKEEYKQINQIVETARRNDGIPRTAQQSIPFQRMFADGICRVTDNYYTKTIQFQDINYQLAQQEDQRAIFEEWCGFLNFFDSSIHFELSFMNMATDAESFEQSIRIPHRKDMDVADHGGDFKEKVVQSMREIARKYPCPNKSGRLKSFCWFCDAFHFTEGQNTDLDYGKRLRKYTMNIHS